GIRIVVDGHIDSPARISEKKLRIIKSITKNFVECISDIISRRRTNDPKLSPRVGDNAAIPIRAILKLLRNEHDHSSRRRFIVECEYGAGNCPTISCKHQIDGGRVITTKLNTGFQDIFPSLHHLFQVIAFRQSNYRDLKFSGKTTICTKESIRGKPAQKG